jgi:hypothetical protein
MGWIIVHIGGEEVGTVEPVFSSLVGWMIRRMSDTGPSLRGCKVLHASFVLYNLAERGKKSAFCDGMTLWAYLGDPVISQSAIASIRKDRSVFGLDLES